MDPSQWWCGKIQVIHIYLYAAWSRIVELYHGQNLGAQVYAAPYYKMGSFIPMPRMFQKKHGQAGVHCKLQKFGHSDAVEMYSSRSRSTKVVIINETTKEKVKIIKKRFMLKFLRMSNICTNFALTLWIKKKGKHCVGWSLLFPTWC